MSNPSLVGRGGHVISGRYLLEAFLGKGAMGEVWRAKHTTLGTPCAVKLVPLTGDPEAVQRLLIEARAAASIVSQNVVKIFDHGQDAGVAYIAMELLVGETLAARLRKHRKLSPHAVVLVTRDIAQGILVAHQQGIIHRDLKPENVFLARTDRGEVAKVLDFGIAKSLSMPGMMTQANVVVGTPAYLSREQVMGTHAVDAQADLWALGILTYECLTGRLPYAAATMAELFVQIVGGGAREMAARASDIPHGFGAWFLRATHPDPTQRFVDARELAETLARVLAPDLSIVPWEVGSVQRPAGSNKKFRGVYIAGAMGVLAAGLTFLAAREALKRSPAPAPDAVAATTTTTASVAPPPSSDVPPPVQTERVPAVSSTQPSAVASTSVAAPNASASTSASASAAPVRRPPSTRYNRWGL